MKLLSHFHFAPQTWVWMCMTNITREYQEDGVPQLSPSTQFLESHVFISSGWKTWNTINRIHYCLGSEHKLRSDGVRYFRTFPISTVVMIFSFVCLPTTLIPSAFIPFICTSRQQWAICYCWWHRFSFTSVKSSSGFLQIVYHGSHDDISQCLCKRNYYKCTTNAVCVCYVHNKDQVNPYQDWIAIQLIFPNDKWRTRRMNGVDGLVIFTFSFRVMNFIE